MEILGRQDVIARGEAPGAAPVRGAFRRADRELRETLDAQERFLHEPRHDLTSGQKGSGWQGVERVDRSCAQFFDVDRLADRRFAQVHAGAEEPVDAAQDEYPDAVVVCQALEFVEQYS